MGTRLKPITDNMPKALVKIGSHTLLELAIERLKLAGASSIVVNVHHFAEQIKDFLASHDFGIDISISDESERLLDTGGGVKKALGLFGNGQSSVILYNVDVLNNADLDAFYDEAKDWQVGLMVSKRKTNRYLLFRDNRLVGWTNIDTGQVKSPFANLDVKSCDMYAFSGIHCFSMQVLPMMDSYPDVFPIMDFYLKECGKLVIKPYIAEDLKLLDVGKLGSIEEARRTFDSSFASYYNL